MKLNNIKKVVFDLSGTTVEDDKAVAKSLHQAAIEYGLQLPLSKLQSIHKDVKICITDTLSKYPHTRIQNSIYELTELLT